MATVQVTPDISVTLPEGLSKETFEQFSPFKRWLERLTRSLELQSRASHPFHQDPYALRGITIQSYDMFGSRRLGFLKLQAEVTTAEAQGSEKRKQHLPGSVFLRGPSVAMLVVLTPEGSSGGPGDGDGESYAVLTVQPRIPAGSLGFLELPAGMLDDGGSFTGAAAKEIEEELGLKLQESDLVCMSELVEEADAPDSAAAAAATPSRPDGPRGQGQDDIFIDEDLPEAMYPSAGGCDEYVPIYAHERRVPRAELEAMAGKQTGLRDHGEKITLKLVKMRDLWKEGRRDAKCLAAVALWEGLKREGKL
ncbi:hypothetical protein BX600DRAFT_437356 [Xylariales sp. PMI_506]|nr:hypothetical protein BX600DRAFT_437356 [Xylariales sp. PMI_506]